MAMYGKKMANDTGIKGYRMPKFEHKEKVIVLPLRKEGLKKSDTYIATLMRKKALVPSPSQYKI